ncbi:unnamed protein product [Somion occarium]|uniref:Secreted protein n=1 Tax=Somion occarium TaxID=3059160 RepID=A0ABP1CP30_9APHY
MQFDTFTWVRLTLGQWLLVASSDSSTSAISLWRTSSNLTENSAGPPWQKPSYRLQSLMDSSTLRITTFHCSQPSKKNTLGCASDSDNPDSETRVSGAGCFLGYLIRPVSAWLLYGVCS